MEIKDDNGKVIAKVSAADVNAAGCDEGVWVEVQADDGTRPTVCLIKDKPCGPFAGGWYLGVYRDTTQKDITACDLAVSFTAEGPVVQATGPYGQVKQVNLFALLSCFESCTKKE